MGVHPLTLSGVCCLESFCFSAKIKLHLLHVVFAHGCSSVGLNGDMTFVADFFLASTLASWCVKGNRKGARG